MRVLGVGETCDLGALYLSLKAEGCDVRVSVSDPQAQGTLAGMVHRCADWRAELPWVREAGAEGVILFESVSEGFGALQDELRRDGFNVIGGSAFGDRLENDRAYAHQVLADLGFPEGHVWEFTAAAEALAFISGRPNRYVLKFSGPGYASSDNYLGQFADGRDVAAMLRARPIDEAEPIRLILMEFIDGVEMGVGAYFNGDQFLTPACLDWEHKRFFAGDLGELTGEMGTVATFDRTDRFFRSTLFKIEPLLRENGFVGYVNLNTIVNARGIWPLEFTCRFGYPGFAVLAPLQATAWGALFRAMVARTTTALATRPGFCVGLVLTTPPFPYSRRDVDEPIGLPVLLAEGVDASCLQFGEVGLDPGGQLVTSGLYGWTMVATGVGETIGVAKAAAYDQARRVVIPNVRYRLDIGERLIGGDFARVEQLGLLDPA